MPTLYKKITDRDRLDFLLKYAAIPTYNTNGWNLSITWNSKTYTFKDYATPRIAIDQALINLQGRKHYVYPTSDTAS